MSATRHESRVGWCPSIATPMEAHDGLLVRIKPTAATISAAAARGLAEASARYGNGEIDLTNRANLQIRGLRSETVVAFGEIAREQGLASPDGAFEEIRNFTADPLGSDDPDAVFDSHAIARSIEAMLATDVTLRALPPKFGFLVDCGRTLPVPDARADIIVRADGDRLSVSVDGGRLEASCTAEDAPALTQRLATTFLKLTGPADTPLYRMRELVAVIDEEAVLAEAGLAGDANELRQPPHWASDRVRDPEATRAATASLAPDISLRDRHLDLMYAPPAAESPIGYVPFPARSTGTVVACVPRGRLRAETLADLAGLAERFADGTLRMTPWRAVVFVPVAAESAADLLTALAGLDLITDPADPRRSLRGPDITTAGNKTRQKAAIS